MSTIDTILTYIDEKTIMEYYYGTFIIERKAIYKNIARNDNKGTCAFFRKGNGRFKLYDFKEGRDFDCIDIVQGLYNCSFGDALKIILRDFNIKPDYETSHQRKIENTSISNKIKAFKYKKRSYWIYDRDYWTRFGITLNTLKNFEVFPIEELYVTKSRKYDAKCYSYQYNEDVCYGININNKFKFYRPNSKENKWLSNTDKDQVYGLEQLDINKSDVIFISSGLKDMLCLNEMGFSAIAPMSESIELNPSVIDSLKRSNKRIIYLFDTDLTGLKKGTLFSIKHNVEAVWLPKQNGLKDVADFCEFYGLQNTKLIIEQIINKNYENE